MKYDIKNKHIFLYFEKYFNEEQYKPENILSLQICLCKDINKIPNNLNKLRYLFLQDNKNIEEIPELNELEILYIENCKKIKILPKHLPKLKKLILINTNIKEIPNTYSNLKILKIKNSQEIKNIPNTFYKLEQLMIINNNQNIIIPYKNLKMIITDIYKYDKNLNINKLIFV